MAEFPLLPPWCPPLDAIPRCAALPEDAWDRLALWHTVPTSWWCAVLAWARAEPTVPVVLRQTMARAAMRQQEAETDPTSPLLPHVQAILGDEWWVESWLRAPGAVRPTGVPPAQGTLAHAIWRGALTPPGDPLDAGAWPAPLGSRPLLPAGLTRVSHARLAALVAGSWPSPSLSAMARVLTAETRTEEEWPPHGRLGDRLWWWLRATDQPTAWWPVIRHLLDDSGAPPASWPSQAPLPRTVGLILLAVSGSLPSFCRHPLWRTEAIPYLRRHSQSVHLQQHWPLGALTEDAIGPWWRRVVEAGHRPSHLGWRAAWGPPLPTDDPHAATRPAPRWPVWWEPSLRPSDVDGLRSACHGPTAVAGLCRAAGRARHTAQAWAVPPHLLQGLPRPSDPAA